MEVGRDGLAVDEVVGVDEGARAPDVEDDGDAGLLGLGPHAEQVGVAGRVPRRAARRDQQRRRALREGVAGGGHRAVSVDQRDVEGGQQARVDRAELEHAPVVGAGGGVGEVGVGVLHVVQAPVVERVEDELAREAEEIEGAGAVLGDEGPRGGEVLARHDLGLLVGPVLGRGVPGPQRLERGQEVALLVGRVAGLAQLVPAGVAQHGQPVPVGGLGVVAQPGRRLHDVGVGVMDDPTLRVGHVVPPQYSRVGRGAPPGEVRCLGPADLTTRQVGRPALATLPGDGSARPPRGRGVPPGGPELPHRAPGG